ncbi:hypothetical protein F2P81_007937 [Scophthalmus maximus]|uniref:Uncharacterized protein n=1 Tax=Scophthalmus maximus TaxID=52904 RepID=A0A6A4TBV9_SCOMX|nr:hypothetical protein F2P81_007937 [Scophthalmus maximus]
MRRNTQQHLGPRLTDGSAACVRAAASKLVRASAIVQHGGRGRQDKRTTSTVHFAKSDSTDTFLSRPQPYILLTSQICQTASVNESLIKSPSKSLVESCIDWLVTVVTVTESVSGQLVSSSCSQPTYDLVSHQETHSDFSSHSHLTRRFHQRKSSITVLLAHKQNPTSISERKKKIGLYP